SRPACRSRSPLGSALAYPRPPWSPRRRAPEQPPPAPQPHASSRVDIPRVLGIDAWSAQRIRVTRMRSPNLRRRTAMRGARIREKLERGGVVLNVMVRFHSPAVIEMLGLAGVDMVLLDAEHGAIDEGMCEHMVRAAEVVDLPAIVRTPRNDAPTILRYLDLGASGVMPPHI